MATVRCASLLAFVAVAVAGGDDDGPCSRHADQIAEELRDQIVAEIAQLGPHRWAGEYEALSSSLFLAPSAGFLYEEHGCLGLMDRDLGAVDERDGRLHLVSIFGLDQPAIAPDLVLVRWGGRRYLVPADDVVGFCNAVNSGDEPRSNLQGRYMLARADVGKPVSGWPEVPPEYRDYLLAEPVEAVVLSVGSPTARPSRVDWCFLDTPLTIDGGSLLGLRPRMQLYVVQRGRFHQWATLTGVGERTSEALLTQVGEDGPLPLAGWRLSTRPPWRPIDPK